MLILLALLGLQTLLELLLWLPLFWRHRRVYGICVGLPLAPLATALVAAHPHAWTVLLWFFSLYRAFNLARVVRGRMHPAYLWRVTRLSELLLVAWQVAATLGALISSHSSTLATNFFTGLAVLQLLVALALFATFESRRRDLERTPVPAAMERGAYPSLTVAIPARNETADLEECLKSHLRSDYPKLEILVLDDRSQNTRTPDIIRSFAHDGVRFLAGTEPEPTWLAKNWAYQQLADAANGELILFCGVDTRFEPQALRQLVTQLRSERRSMLSILPANAGPAGLLSLLLQPARYAWELALPRGGFFNRPPVLSTCWLATRQLLSTAGSFKAVSRSIVPESYFARTAAVHQGYGFIRDDGVLSRKLLEEQSATAIRTRYPQLHRRPELVALIALAELVFLASPFCLLLAALLTGDRWTVSFCAPAVLLLAILYTRIVTLTYRRFQPLSVLIHPLAALYDIWLLHVSMYRYEFGAVVWKGREVNTPVMHVVPHLPNLE